MKSGHVIRRLRFLLPCVVLIAFANTPAGAATNVVTTLADSGPGSLRQAITDANAVGGGNISISVTGTISLVSSLLPLTNICISGPGTNFVTIRGTNIDVFATNGFRIFSIPMNSTAMLERITIAHGYGILPGGGAILNSGVLTLTQCFVISNAAKFGGGVCSQAGSLTVRESIFANNYVRGASAPPYASFPMVGGTAAGGAIYASNSAVVIATSGFINNGAAGGSGSFGDVHFPGTGGRPGGGADGGALHFDGANAALTNCWFYLNGAYGGYGGGWAPGGGGGESGGAGFGGALFVRGTAVIVGCQFGTNSVKGGSGGSGGGGDAAAGAFAAGGALALLDGPTLISNCSITGNSANGGAGGFGSRGGRGGLGGVAAGGGIWANNVTVSIREVTAWKNRVVGGGGGSAQDFLFSSGQAGNGGNAYGGAIASTASSFILNSTISENTAIYGARGYSNGLPGSAFGGGIWSDGSTLGTNVTVAFNMVTQGFGGGVYGPVSVRNCLVSGNHATNGPDVAGITSLGYNLFGRSEGLAIPLPSDVLNVNATIGALADNGGPTLTHALASRQPGD